MRLSTVIAGRLRGWLQPVWHSRRRDLRRELKEQSTEDYWRRRERSRSRRFWLVARRYRLESLLAGSRDSIGIVRGAIPSLLRALAYGGLLLVAVLALEMGLADYVAPKLIPSGDSLPPLGTFPTLAVQVSASLLGFYLASVGIVLGMSYRDVSAGVRALVLGNARTRLYLASIGTAIGGGLTLVLLQSFGIPYGYGTVGVYALLVAFSGWAFTQLAFGAFNLLDPIVLGREPLRVLYRAIERLESKGLLGDQAVLQATAREADRALRILAELIDATSNRGQADQDALVGMVNGLLLQVRFYAHRKHLLEPTSAWFLPEPVYPKWVEADYSETSIALQTSTPLQPKTAPATDWLERRSAELASAALKACVDKDNREAALRITREVASTTRILATNGRLDDSIAFSGIVRDRCWAIQPENAAALAVAAEPPLMVTNLLLGWRDAIVSWPDEVRTTVAATEWDRANATVVQIRGPTRLWTAAQGLLREVRAEHEIQGHRATPDWYLRFALAGECILSLREFAEQFPKLLEDFVEPALKRSSPTLKAMAGSQALQSLMKAQLVVDTVPQVMKDLESLRLGHDPQPIEELENLGESIQACRSLVLTSMAEATKDLRPERSTSTPDLFGEALFSLVHHTEQAIANGMWNWYEGCSRRY